MGADALVFRPLSFRQVCLRRARPRNATSTRSTNARNIDEASILFRRLVAAAPRGSAAPRPTIGGQAPRRTASHITDEAPDLQRQTRTAPWTGTLFGVPPLPLRVPRLPRAALPGLDLCPALVNSAVRMDYYDFVDVVVNGRKNGNSVMPGFGTNKNVMCYLDDIYVYLKAVGDERSRAAARPSAKKSPRPTPRPKMPAWAGRGAPAPRAALGLAAPAAAQLTDLVSAPPSGSVPTRPTCRSRTRRARGSRTHRGALRRRARARAAIHLVPDGAGLRAAHPRRRTAAT